MLLTLPLSDDGANGIRLALVVALSAKALLLLWFATRGGVVELHLDLLRGELKEIVRHRIGPQTVVGRHGFGSEMTLTIDRTGSTEGSCGLILRLKGQEAGICIAEGPEESLLELRRRIQQDLRRSRFVGSEGARHAD